MTESWGTSGFDDEGQPVRRNVLIENGVLTDYMWDFVRGHKEGRESSGNGRRQSYQHLPMVRMANTYLLPHRRCHDRRHRFNPVRCLRRQAPACGSAERPATLSSG